MADKDILSENAYAYGTLNPVGPKKDKMIYDSGMDPADLLRMFTRSMFQSDSTKGLTQFKAVVLRVENPVGEDDLPFGFLETIAPFLGAGANTDSKKFVSVKAMIPEIHGSILPSPKGNGSAQDNHLIDMYPIFTARSNDIEQPAVGDIVWVTFENIENLEGGVLISNIKRRTLKKTSASAKPSSKFGPCGRLLGKPASGGKLDSTPANIVANFPDLGNHYTPIDVTLDRGRIPEGKGIFTNMYANLGAFPVSQAIDAGLDFVITLGMWQWFPGEKVNGKIKKDKSASLEKVKEFVDAYAAAGIRVYLFGFPNIHKIDEWVDYMFATAYASGCAGVISDPEAGFQPKGKWNMSNAKLKQKVREFTDKCNAAAYSSGLCYGVTSYEIPQFQPKLKYVLADLAPADFVIPQSYRAAPEYGPKNMIKGIKAYVEAGFTNIMAMGSLYGTKTYNPFYPQYGTRKKPPEEIIRRTSWLLGDSAQDYIDHKGALAYWSWEAANGGTNQRWPMNSWFLLKNMANEIDNLASETNSTAMVASEHLKEVTDTSSKQKRPKEDGIDDSVRASEEKDVGLKTTREKSAESDVAASAIAKSKLTPQQEATLSEKRKKVSDLKKEREELADEIEGLSSTALKGDISYIKAQELRGTLSQKDKELSQSLKSLNSLEKQLNLEKSGAGISSSSATQRPKAAKCRRSKGEPKETRPAKNSTPPSSKAGVDGLQEYIYDNTEISLSSGTRFKSNRVRAGNFPQKFLNKDLIVDCYGKPMHKLAAKRVVLMNKAWSKETGNRKFRLASGLREPPEIRYKWLLGRRGDKHPSVKKAKSSGVTSLKQLFDLFLIDEYGSVRKGRTLRAWNSPHETGLAFDIRYRSPHPDRWKEGSMGPYSKTNSKQKQGELYKWVKKNAYRWGISPYKAEAWHWEVQLTREAWYTGEDYVTDGEYSIYVAEKSTQTALNTNNKEWSGKGFV
jgi:hypothetical protein